MNKNKLFLLAGFLLSLSLLLSACDSIKTKSPDVQWQFVPMPDLSKQPLHLKVAHVTNDRFKSLSSQQLNKVLNRTQQLIKQHFNLHVVFENEMQLPIADFFAYLPEKVIEGRGQFIINPNNLTELTLQQMRNSIRSTLIAYEQDQQSVIDYAKPYLVDNCEVCDLTELSNELVKTMLARIKFWFEYKASDGQPILNRMPYNEWVWWDSMGYSDMPYDVVITNQLVASIENYGMAVHSSLRGGITGGTMTYSKKAAYKSYVFISTFQLLDDSDMIAKLRDDEKYTQEQIVNYVAALLTHELGHLFFHYGHPFNAPSCIMNPTPLLKYREWYEGFDIEACKAGGYPMMEPGAVQIDFNPEW
jgi:hypothetical protein